MNKIGKWKIGGILKVTIIRHYYFEIIKLGFIK